jgi:TolB-like protein/DNA-binding winged helix-turn-helix (wHTH) protein/tetratricopeptide (TPR) repeat protein
MAFDRQSRKIEGIQRARARVPMRGSGDRYVMNQHPVYRFDDFVVDAEAWRLTRDGQEIHLKPVVLKLLIYLIANRGRLVTREELMDTVWGDTVISESALTKAAARLRKALGDDSATHRYLETVRSQGYRFVANVEEIESPEEPGLPPGQTGAATVRRALYAGAVTIVALISLAVFWFRAPPHQEVTRSLAVLPLSNLTGDAEQGYYADGLQDLLITELSQLAGLRVTSRQSTKRYRDSELGTAAIAGELGVDALVEGSLLSKGREIEVTIQLIDGRSDEHLWAERYAREAPDVFGLISDMANAIGARIGAGTASPVLEKSSYDRIGQIDPRAVDAYALGTTNLDRFTPDSIRSAIDHFERAVSIEPGFALAWSGLAGAHAMQALVNFARPRESIEIARVAALKAIEADDQFFSGHSALGWAHMWTWNIDSACESFEKALRLNPSAPAAIHGDADCLMFEGRTDESIARLRELLVVSPFSAMHNFPLPIHLYMERRFDEAIAAANGMQTRTPQFPMHWFLARVYWQQGRFDEALAEERLQLEWFGNTVLLAALEQGLEAAGPAGAMRAKAEAMVARANETYVDPFDIAENFALAGMVDEALLWLDKALENGTYETTYIAFWPHLDVLRDDPRFQDLMERVYGENAQEIGRLGNLGQ